MLQHKWTEDTQYELKIINDLILLLYWSDQFDDTQAIKYW